MRRRWPWAAWAINKVGERTVRGVSVRIEREEGDGYEKYFARTPWKRFSKEDLLALKNELERNHPSVTLWADPLLEGGVLETEGKTPNEAFKKMRIFLLENPKYANIWRGL